MIAHFTSRYTCLEIFVLLETGRHLVGDGRKDGLPHPLHLRRTQPTGFGGELQEQFRTAPFVLATCASSRHPPIAGTNRERRGETASNERC